MKQSTPMSLSSAPSKAHIRILLILSCAWFGWSGDSHACRCSFENQTGFIHATGENGSPAHLPANARGVLFLATLDASKIGIVSTDGTEKYLVSAIPPKLIPESFSIKEDQQENRLKVIIQRINVETQLYAPQQQARYYSFQNTADKACYMKRNRKACGTDTKAMQWIDNPLASGKLRDVTDAVESGQGLFRIGPADGFQAEKTYSITKLGEKQVTVVIDDALITSPKDRFELKLDDTPLRRALAVPSGGGPCTENIAAIVQNLRYSIPSAYASYQHAMVYFTQRKYLAGKAHPTYEKEEQFGHWRYSASSCSRTPYGGSQVGAGKELVYTWCNSNSMAPQTTQMKGFVGLLEVDERLHETPILTVNFNPATGESCEPDKQSLQRPISNGQPVLN